jgi:aldehyde dehydrogenase (NAD+)
MSLSKLFSKRSFSAVSEQHKFKPKLTQLLIDGKFVNSSSGKTFDTINPTTEEKIVSVQEADSIDVDKAVRAARRAFDLGPWRRMAASERGRLIYKFAELIEQNIEELGTLETIDNGKPFKYAKDVDILAAVNTFKYYAGWADKIHG